MIVYLIRKPIYLGYKPKKLLEASNNARKTTGLLVLVATYYSNILNVKMSNSFSGIRNKSGIPSYLCLIGNLARLLDSQLHSYLT